MSSGDDTPTGEAGAGEVPVDCSIAAALEIVGDRWTILILRDAFRGIRRFDELRRDLDIPRAVLSERLRRLVDSGVLVKRRYQERPERFEYRLTPMGLQLSPILVSLMQWGDRWLSGEDGPPTALVHEPCGTEIDLGYYCWTCETPFAPTAIASRPGHDHGGSAARHAHAPAPSNTTKERPGARTQRTARPAAR
ncbi:MAG: winged helix-turn-helix transcriptional regulator [Microthrixaceae bacterium]